MLTAREKKRQLEHKFREGPRRIKRAETAQLQQLPIENHQLHHHYAERDDDYDAISPRLPTVMTTGSELLTSSSSLIHDGDASATAIVLKEKEEGNKIQSDAAREAESNNMSVTGIVLLDATTLCGSDSESRGTDGEDKEQPSPIQQQTNNISNSSCNNSSMKSIAAHSDDIPTLRDNKNDKSFIENYSFESESRAESTASTATTTTLSINDPQISLVAAVSTAEPLPFSAEKKNDEVYYSMMNNIRPGAFPPVRGPGRQSSLKLKAHRKGSIKEEKRRASMNDFMHLLQSRKKEMRRGDSTCWNKNNDSMKNTPKPGAFPASGINGKWKSMEDNKRRRRASMNDLPNLLETKETIWSRERSSSLRNIDSTMNVPGAFLVGGINGRRNSLQSLKERTRRETTEATTSIKRQSFIMTTKHRASVTFERDSVNDRKREMDHQREKIMNNGWVDFFDGSRQNMRDDDDDEEIMPRPTLFVGRVPTRYLRPSETFDVDSDRRLPTYHEVFGSEMNSPKSSTPSSRFLCRLCALVLTFVFVLAFFVALPLTIKKLLIVKISTRIHTYTNLTRMCVNTPNAELSDIISQVDSNLLSEMDRIRNQLLNLGATTISVSQQLHPCSAEALALLFLSSTTTTSDNSSPLLVDTFALVSLYFATKGGNWRNNTNWLSEGVDSICFWFGVTCTGTTDGNHTSTNTTDSVFDNNSTRTTFISALVLDDNFLDGTIPQAFYMLNKTKKLSLENNEIRGSISSAVGMMTELEHLDLMGNLFEGHIPSEVGELSLLSHLGVGGEGLVGPLPSEIALPRLETLRIASSSSSSLLSPLQTFSMGEIPLTLATKSLHLTELNLTGPFSGTFPEEFWRSTSLQILSLKGSFISGSLMFGPNNTNWRHIQMSFGNRFVGKIPSEIGLLTKLQNLKVQFNFLFGSIPSEIGQCLQLEDVRIPGGEMTGTLPTEIGNLSLLQHLHVDNNKLTGTIPTEFARLEKLKSLWLAGLKSEDILANEEEKRAHFVGTVPNSLCDIDSLTSFILPCNTGVFESCPPGCCECIEDD